MGFCFVAVSFLLALVASTRPAEATEVTGVLFTKKCSQRCGFLNLGSRMRRVSSGARCQESCVYFNLLATLLGEECGTCNSTSAPTAPMVPAPKAPTVMVPTVTPPTVPLPTPTVPLPTPTLQQPTPAPLQPIPATAPLPAPPPTTPTPPLSTPTPPTVPAPSALTPAAGIICAVSVALGKQSNVAGNFVNVAINQSLVNVVNCLGPLQGEAHTQSSHVWWNPSPLELIFTFAQDHDVSKVYFWNYNDEPYDVDTIDLTFYNAQEQVVGRYNYLPRVALVQNGLNMPENVTFAVQRGVRRVSAVLNATNGELDFQNMLFAV